jgi:hypothetical protein
MNELQKIVLYRSINKNLFEIPIANVKRKLENSFSQYLSVSTQCSETIYQQQQ